jgi:hypothetical protein
MPSFVSYRPNIFDPKDCLTESSRELYEPSPPYVKNHENAPHSRQDSYAPSGATTPKHSASNASPETPKKSPYAPASSKEIEKYKAFQTKQAAQTGKLRSKRVQKPE